MANLTEMSIGFRKFILYLLYAFIGYLVLKVLISFGVQYWKMTHPPVLPPPNMKFNKLPKPIFSIGATQSAGLIFTLENIEGKPPESTDAGRVYAMPKKLPTLLSPDRALKFASKIDFTKEPNTVSSTMYYFTDPRDDKRTLSLDIVNMNFQLKYDYQKTPEIFTEGQINTKEQPVEDVSNYIRSNGLFDESIAKGKITTELLTYEPSEKTFREASSLSAANTVRVNFFRQDLDGWKILPPEFSKSYNYALYTPGKKIQVIELFYTFWPIAFDDFGTYPLISAASAWEELIGGKATVVNFGGNSRDNIVIRNIYLAYYDSENPQMYLQPIFVFEGDNNFVAYLPAITSDWLE